MDWPSKRQADLVVNFVKPIVFSRAQTICLMALLTVLLSIEVMNVPKDGE